MRSAGERLSSVRLQGNHSSGYFGRLSVPSIRAAQQLQRTYARTEDASHTAPVQLDGADVPMRYAVARGHHIPYSFSTAWLIPTQLSRVPFFFRGCPSDRTPASAFQSVREVSTHSHIVTMRKMTSVSRAAIHVSNERPRVIPKILFSRSTAERRDYYHSHKEKSVSLLPRQHT